jgi:hypothetical protein
MGEADLYIFSFKEIAEALIKKQNIHEGIWGVYIEFGLSAANINAQGPTGEEAFLPAAIIPVAKIGIRKYEKENSLSVDAAKVNPVSTPAKKKPLTRKLIL